jgi:hypothetical protein
MIGVERSHLPPAPHTFALTRVKVFRGLPLLGA